MVWVGKVFNPRVEATEAFPKPYAPQARYQAGLMDLDELGARLRRQAAQAGMDRAEQWVALTDGGNGLDDGERPLPPGCADSGFLPCRRTPGRFCQSFLWQRHDHGGGTDNSVDS